MILIKTQDAGLVEVVAIEIEFLVVVDQREVVELDAGAVEQRLEGRVELRFAGDHRVDARRDGRPDDHHPDVARLYLADQVLECGKIRAVL